MGKRELADKDSYWINKYNITGTIITRTKDYDGGWQPLFLVGEIEGARTFSFTIRINKYSGGYPIYIGVWDQQ